MTKAIELSQLGNVLTVAEGTGNVGIRESSPSYEFHVKGAGTVAYFEGTGGNSFIGLEDSDDSTVAFIGVDGGSLKFQTSGSSYSDKLVIAPDGNILIGKTASSGLNAGCEFRPAGMGLFTRASANPLQVRRLTDDGDLVEFYQDAGLIGSVGVDGTSLTIGMAGATRLKISTGGHLLVAQTESESIGGGPQAIQTKSGFSTLRRTNDPFGPYINLGKSRNTSANQFTPLQDEDVCGHIGFCGDDGTDINNACAYINGVIDGTPSENNLPGALTFRTVASGTISTERMRIASGGQVLINDKSLGSSRTDAPLQIETGSSGNALNLRARSSDDAYSYINFQNNAATQVAAEIYMVRSSANNGGNLIFGTANPNSSAPSQRMMISSGGATTMHVNSPSHETFRFTTQGVNEAKLMMKDASSNVDIQLNTAGDSWFNGGRVGIGTTAPGGYDGEANDLVIRSPDHTGITIASTGSNQRCNLYFSDGTSTTEKYRGAITYDHNDDNMYMRTAGIIRVRVDSDGNVATGGSALFHGSSVLSDFTNAGRDNYKLVSIRAGDPQAGATPTNGSSAIKIYPAGARSATAGNLTGGIAWQHLDPNYSSWSSTYGAGAQIWMGAALHDTPGQERDRFNLWMNSQTTGNSQPNNLAIEVYPNGMVRHPKVPAFMVRNSTSASAFSANAVATWNTVILNNSSSFGSNKFTAPIDGVYHFNCQMLSNNNTRLFQEFRVNQGRVDGTKCESHALSGSYQTVTITMTYFLNQNDYVDVYVSTSAAYGSIYANFNGFLIG